MEKIKLCKMDKFILKLFPESEVYEDGVECDFDLLKQKTIDIIKLGREDSEDVVNIHFNMDNLEVYIDGIGFVLEYDSLIEN